MFTNIPKWSNIIKLNINQCLKGNIYKKLTLSQLGIDSNNLTDLKLEFNNLPIDKNYKNIKSNKAIKCNKITVDVSDFDNFKFYYNNLYSYNMKGNYNSSDENYDTINSSIVNKDFVNLITQITAMTVFNNNSIKKLDLSLYQIRLMCFPKYNYQFLEKFHTHNKDFICNYIVNKSNINGGDYKLYNSNHTKLYDNQLNSNDILIHDDKNLYHKISNLTNDTNCIGYYDLLSFNYKIIK